LVAAYVADLETAVAYLFNVALSEALLQVIAAVEIGLRNSIHTMFTKHAGADQWFWAMLKQNDLKVINEKWARLATRLKSPPTAGKLIADLTFGFWPYLFDHRYHHDTWWPNGEALFKAVFPYLPTGLPPHQKIGRAEMFERLSLFADMRNRVMHHEPILFGLPRPNLGTPPPIVSIDDVHRQIVEVVGWIDPQLALTLSFVDRFPDVHLNEEARIRVKLKTHFGIK
jgi:hypothetical protein